MMCSRTTTLRDGRSALIRPLTDNDTELLLRCFHSFGAEARGFFRAARNLCRLRALNYADCKSDRLGAAEQRNVKRLPLWEPSIRIVETVETRMMKKIVMLSALCALAVALCAAAQAGERGGGRRGGRAGGREALERMLEDAPEDVKLIIQKRIDGQDLD
ncbi:MAG: hypothetical protein HQ592_16470, partial [Planctomycetes bacterium]|nr:hypothetical protein [Planctomycetota bacterium]